jgi:predicted nucleic acid-binding Zn ribbon protein
MYCANCGTPLAPGLSFCNRCGNSLKERGETSQTGSITAFLTAITLVAVIGLGIMLGGALALRKDANFPTEFVAFFLLLTFLIVGMTEILLFKQLSRLTHAVDNKSSMPRAGFVPAELPPARMSNLPEPLPSVTENTTRTLEFSRREK